MLGGGRGRHANPPGGGGEHAILRFSRPSRKPLQRSSLYRSAGHPLATSPATIAAEQAQDIVPVRLKFSHRGSMASRPGSVWGTCGRRNAEGRDRAAAGRLPCGSARNFTIESFH